MTLSVQKGNGSWEEGEIVNGICTILLTTRYHLLRMCALKEKVQHGATDLLHNIAPAFLPTAQNVARNEPYGTQQDQQEDTNDMSLALGDTRFNKKKIKDKKNVRNPQMMWLWLSKKK
eukprot:759425_1